MRLSSTVIDFVKNHKDVVVKNAGYTNRYEIEEPILRTIVWNPYLIIYQFRDRILQKHGTEEFVLKKGCKFFFEEYIALLVDSFIFKKGSNEDAIKAQKEIETRIIRSLRQLTTEKRITESNFDRIIADVLSKIIDEINKSASLVSDLPNAIHYRLLETLGSKSPSHLNPDAVQEILSIRENHEACKRAEQIKADRYKAFRSAVKNEILNSVFDHLGESSGISIAILYDPSQPPFRVKDLKQVVSELGGTATATAIATAKFRACKDLKKILFLEVRRTIDQRLARIKKLSEFVQTFSSIFQRNASSLVLNEDNLLAFIDQGVVCGECLFSLLFWEFLSELDKI